MTAYTEEEILLQVDNVSKDYGAQSVLKSVSATIRDIKVVGQVKGQVVGFIGPSGIGKSTLFRIMAGLDKATSGRVLIDGKDVEAGQVGVVAQSYPLFAHRTVLGNLTLATKGKISVFKVLEHLQTFGLLDIRNKYPAQLSGGQRQRVAILQQILTQNHVILMDEPFSGLDPIAKKQAQKLIQEVADLDDLNTIIIVTHDILAAVNVADHIWVMGRERSVTGEVVPGAYIVKTFNLIDMDLAWTPEGTNDTTRREFVQQVEKLFESL